MGLTIHYKGNLKEPEMVYPLIDEMREVAQTMDWPYEVIDNDWNLPDTTYIDHEGRIQGYSALKGIMINVNDQCETLSLLFDARGTLRNLLTMALEKNKTSWQHTKTQSAPVEVHISIVRLMKYLSNKYFEQFEVIDEGEFWETDDIVLLTQKHNHLSHLIAKVGDALEIGLENNSLSGLPIVQRIESILSKLSKNSLR